jgi:hypothetical protein
LPYEQWKPVRGFERYYKVSSLGRVKAIARPVWNGKCWYLRPEQFLKRTDGNGYFVADLVANGKHRVVRHHILVAEHFIGERPRGKMVLHGDGNQGNKQATNLRYGTQKENIADAFKHRTLPFGTKHPGAKLTDQQVKIIKESPFRWGLCISLARQFKVSPSLVTAIRRGEKRRG